MTFVVTMVPGTEYDLKRSVCNDGTTVIMSESLSSSKDQDEAAPREQSAWTLPHLLWVFCFSPHLGP
jgi:hypothetical protein